MKDVTTKKRILVSADGTSGPYVMVPIDQLDQVKHLLDDRGIGYWADEDAISIDGEPYVSVINLGRGADPKVVQEILDSVA